MINFKPFLDTLGPGSYHICYPKENCSCWIKDPETKQYRPRCDTESKRNGYSSTKGSFGRQERGKIDYRFNKMVIFSQIFS